MKIKAIVRKLGAVAKDHATLVGVLLLVAVIAVVNVMAPITLPGAGKA